MEHVASTAPNPSQLVGDPELFGEVIFYIVESDKLSKEKADEVRSPTSSAPTPSY